MKLPSIEETTLLCTLEAKKKLFPVWVITVILGKEYFKGACRMSNKSHTSIEHRHMRTCAFPLPYCGLSNWLNEKQTTKSPQLHLFNSSRTMVLFEEMVIFKWKFFYQICSPFSGHKMLFLSRRLTSQNQYMRYFCPVKVLNIPRT